MTENKELQKNEDNLPAQVDNNPIRAFFAGPKVMQKFQELLGSKSQGFVTSVLQITQGNEKLKACNPTSIFNAAATAATMDLPINQNLGFAWIVPYAGQAQFQMGYKGFIQLAQRSGQYRRLNVATVYKNQFKSWNELTEELDADFNKLGEGNPVGFVAYFELLNGFTKTVYWSAEKVLQHANRYSKGISRNDSLWKTDFDKMGMKTVLKYMLNIWGILSIEMQTAMKVDQAIIHDEDGLNVTYIDNEITNEDKANKTIDATTAAMKELSSKATGK